MDIVTLAAARKGSGGGASKEYVDEKVAALINDTTAAQNKTYSSAKVEEKVAGEEITTTATGSDLTLSTSSGNLNALTVYGKSEVVDNKIVSAGEGWATVDLGTLTWGYTNNRFYASINIKTYNSNELAPLTCSKYPAVKYNGQNADLGDETISSYAGYIYVKDMSYEANTSTFTTAMSGVLLCYELADPTQGNCIAVKTDDGSGFNGTMATFTTGTPLRATLDGTTRDEMHYNGITGEVITRCEIVNDEVVPLATPIITPLTAQEMTALAGLRTFTPQTHAQNNAGAVMTLEAYAGTANGQAVNELKQDVQSEISALKITQSGTLTLTAAGWSNNAQTVTYAHDTAKRNVIDVEPSSIEEWANCGILATAETASGITFTCKTVPENALTFRVTSMGV